MENLVKKPPSTPTRCDAEAKAGRPSPKMSAKTPEAKPADHQRKGATPKTGTGQINPNPVEKRRKTNRRYPKASIASLLRERLKRENGEERELFELTSFFFSTFCS